VGVMQTMMPTECGEMLETSAKSKCACNLARVDRWLSAKDHLFLLDRWKFATTLEVTS
jgi:hypothetical protein